MFLEESSLPESGELFFIRAKHNPEEMFQGVENFSIGNIHLFLIYIDIYI